jgi:hypothetical protein
MAALQGVSSPEGCQGGLRLNQRHLSLQRRHIPVHPGAPWRRQHKGRRVQHDTLQAGRPRHLRRRPAGFAQVKGVRLASRLRAPRRILRLLAGEHRRQQLS